jgi:hypothetical protein
MAPVAGTKIHDGAQREALHAARLLERQLAVTPA